MIEVESLVRLKSCKPGAYAGYLIESQPKHDKIGIVLSFDIFYASGGLESSVEILWEDGKIEKELSSKLEDIS